MNSYFMRLFLFIFIIILLFFIILYYERNNERKNEKYNYIKQKNRIIVSMTTIPERINIIHKTLDSLQNQTFKPDIIYIHIGKELKNKDYPTNELNRLKDIINNYSNVRLNIIEKDLGPITKVIPVLPFINDNDYLILADDDVSYKPNMIEYLVKSDQIAVGYAGRKNLEFITGKSYTGTVDFLETYAGVLYRNNILQGLDEYYKEVADLCKFQDDIVIGSFVRRKGENPFIISYDLQSHHDAGDTPQLSNFNLKDGNKICYDRIFTKYN